MTDPKSLATSQQAAVDAALVVLKSMGLSLEDLTAAPRDQAAVPTFAGGLACRSDFLPGLRMPRLSLPGTGRGRRCVWPSGSPRRSCSRPRRR